MAALQTGQERDLNSENGEENKFNEAPGKPKKGLITVRRHLPVKPKGEAGRVGSVTRVASREHQLEKGEDNIQLTTPNSIQNMYLEKPRRHQRTRRGRCCTLPALPPPPRGGAAARPSSSEPSSSSKHPPVCSRSSAAGRSQRV